MLGPRGLQQANFTTSQLLGGSARFLNFTRGPVEFQLESNTEKALVNSRHT